MKKLKLNKEVIASLSNNEMDMMQGGQMGNTYSGFDSTLCTSADIYCGISANCGGGGGVCLYGAGIITTTGMGSPAAVTATITAGLASML